MTLATPLYPDPSVSIRPVISFESFKGSQRCAVPSVLKAGQVEFLTSGRVAIARALLRLDIKRGERVLLPAYNCRAMVDPVVAVSAEPVLYRIREDLSLDLEDIDSKLDLRVRAIVAVHYFGFFQELGALRELCDNEGIALIEDCAHAFFGEHHGKPVGAIGDFAVASPMKFMPVYDGGCLVASGGLSGAGKLRGGGSLFEIKAATDVVERAMQHDRLNRLALLLRAGVSAKRFLWTRAKRARADHGDVSVGPNSADGGYEFDKRWLDIKMSHSSRILLRLLCQSRIVNKRRKNYEMIVGSLERLTGGYAIKEKLPDKVVPYVVPFFVKNPERVFPQLKTQGVPIYRWEDVDPAVCEVSACYSKHLFQFPCHQELNQAELGWLIEKIAAAIRTTGGSSLKARD